MGGIAVVMDAMVGWVVVVMGLGVDGLCLWAYAWVARGCAWNVGGYAWVWMWMGCVRDG